MSMTAEILAVGTELLLGNIANTDAQAVSQELSALGINVYFHTVVGDNPGRLTQAVELAKGRADILITTGGLGPTLDDLTKETVAACFGKKLKLHRPSLKRIQEYFERLDRPMTENNRRQAYLPEGCTVFTNDWGTAPGCAFEAGGKHVLMLPGPPRECVPMLKERAVPYLKKLSDAVLVSREIRIFGMGESSVEDRLHDLMERGENPTVAPYAKEGEVMLRVTAKAETEERARALTEPMVLEICETLGDVVYGVDEESLESVVLKQLVAKGKTLSTAESCTGGLVSKRMTDLPGASRAFLGGMCTYATETKIKFLGLDPHVVTQRGVVSAEVAAAMAKGIRRVMYSDYGVGITGLAGPEGDGVHPVGTVFVAIDGPQGEQVRSLQLGQNRDRIRTMAANHAFDMLKKALDLE